MTGLAQRCEKYRGKVMRIVRGDKNHSVFLDNEKVAEYDFILYSCISKDGEHYALHIMHNGLHFVRSDDIEHKPYQYIYNLIFSPDGKHLVYYAEKNYKEYCVVIDGIEQPAYWQIQELVFSPDSKHFAYCGIKNSNEYCAVIDGIEHQTYPRIRDLTFSPDSKHFIYCAIKDYDKCCAVIDGKEEKEYNRISRFQYSPKGILVYRAERGGLDCIVFDGKESKWYDRTSMCIFSYDDHYAYIAKKDKKWCIVLDGIEGVWRSYEIIDIKFQYDLHLVYSVGKYGAQTTIIEDILW